MKHGHEPDPTSSSDLQKRREYLQLRQEQREYDRMVNGTVDFSHSHKSDTLAKTLSGVQNQISIIANMFVSIFAMFGVGYYIGMQYKWQYQTRFICGLIGAVVILFIEMTLYIIRACNMEYAEKPKTKDTTNKINNRFTPKTSLAQDENITLWDYSHPREDDDVDLNITVATSLSSVHGEQVDGNELLVTNKSNKKNN